MLDGYRPDNSIVHIKNRRHLRYVDFAKDDETRFDTSNYEIERPLPKGRNKKVTALIMMKNKDEKDKDRKIMTEFAALKATQLKNKMNQLEKDKADVYSLRGNHKELI